MEVQIVATANIPAEGQTIRPFAALDPAVEQALLNHVPLVRLDGLRFLPADVPPLGVYLANINPNGMQFDLLPPPPSLSPLDNQLVSSFEDIPVESDYAGVVRNN